MSEKRLMTTPMNVVFGLGSAKEGTSHWWSQRISSVALIPLTLLFVVPFGRAIGGGYEAVTALYGDPWHALVAILFLAVGFWHLAQGLQVVIEDYVHDKLWRTILMLANTLGSGLGAAAGIFAIAKLAFAA